MALVVDASVAFGWLVRTQATSLTRAALDAVEEDSGWVPAHFAIEIARSLRTHERRNQLSPTMVDQAVVLLQQQWLHVDAADPVEQIPRVVLLARRYLLRVADAGYLDLALRLNLPLATRDAALARAAEAAGAAVFKS
jgi:predicted nucleic acid-binding protein